jgi:hypothetical protein
MGISMRRWRRLRGKAKAEGEYPPEAMIVLAGLIRREPVPNYYITPEMEAKKPPMNPEA